MTGFTITPDWITPAEESQLVGRIRTRLSEATEKDSRGGRSAILRFGWDYSDENVWVRDIPEWLMTFWFTASVRAGVAPQYFNSVTVNRYQRGEAISPHLDSIHFVEPIMILSLLSEAMMDFHENGRALIQSSLLPARSVVTLKDEARYKYRHSIAPVKAERISVVFRERII